MGSDVGDESFDGLPSIEALNSVYKFSGSIGGIMPNYVPDGLSKGFALITKDIKKVYLINEEMEKQVRDSAVIKEKEKEVNTLERIIATEYLKEETSKNVLEWSEQEMVRIEAATKGVNQLIAITKESATELKDIVLETVNAGTLDRIAALLNTTKQKMDAAAGGLNAIAYELAKKEKAEKEQAKQAAIIDGVIQAQAITIVPTLDSITENQKVIAEDQTTMKERLVGDDETIIKHVAPSDITRLEQKITELEQKLEQKITGLSDLLTQFLEMQQNKENK
jgi:hypothetical protein